MTVVYFGTNRNPEPSSKPSNFGKGFNPAGLTELRFGKATVTGKKVAVGVIPESIPKTAAATATASTKAKAKAKAAPRLGSTALFDGLRQIMAEKERDTIVFIHGYNVSFKEAMQSAATIAQNFAHLNGGNGVNVLTFSWPSDGSMLPFRAYKSDRHDALASGPALARGFLKLRDFFHSLETEEACEQRVHLIAHSMGNYVLRHGLQELRKQSATLPRMFDQIFLMAADEDDDAFEHEHKLKLLPRLARNVNVYFNRGDTAMAISDTTKGNPDRLGDEGPRAPFQVPAKVVQVDCSAVVHGFVEHSYFLDEPKVVADMAQVLSGVDPMLVAGRRFLDDRNRFVIVDA
ncbi:MAG: alpha/beta fold hydrolase [Planctomycetes bacterium]|nr:alpha/beta fold hydrolase [Planctomycetota bacterium]